MNDPTNTFLTIMPLLPNPSEVPAVIADAAKVNDASS